jgi:hypothetical protein
MIKQLNLTVLIDYDTEKEEIVNYATSLNGIQEKHTTTTPKKSVKKNSLEGLTVKREDNKLVLSESLVEALGAQPEDRINVLYDRDTVSKTITPIIMIDNGGNKLTKSNTVAYKGKANTTLAEFGSIFKAEPYKEGVFKLIGDSLVAKDIEIAQAVKEVDLGIDVLSDEKVEIEDIDFNF